VVLTRSDGLLLSALYTWSCWSRPCCELEDLRIGCESSELLSSSWYGHPTPVIIVRSRYRGSCLPVAYLMVADGLICVL
jgi:hypothetical protein